MILPHEYTDHRVTPWGGMKEMKMVIEKTGIRQKLAELPLPESRSNNSIDPVDIIESFWVGIWIGCFRFSHTAVVRMDEVLREIFNWKRVPSGTTYGRFFKKFTPSMNHAVFTKLNQWFLDQITFDNYTLDVDSSVITRYGEQQGSHRGYNPQKPGRNSHHPLFAFVSNLRMVANCWNRSGDTSSSSNAINFLAETFSILANRKVGLFRADSGFCTSAILDYIESKHIPYVMSCKLYARLQSAIYNLQGWFPVGEGIWVKKKATGRKLKTLFDEQQIDAERVFKTRYHAFVTNQDLPAEEVWAQYKRRADAENRIKELKEDFAVQGFCMDNFSATETAMRFVMIAYNLMALFRVLTSQTRPSPKLSTLRFNCFAVGGWIETRGGFHKLKLSVPLKRRQWYDGLFSKIEQTNLPISLSG
jgi:hypothetical protein